MPNANPEADPVSASAGPGVFATTHWSVVLMAGQSDSPHAAEALETLCRTYWYPLYVYVRRQGNSPHDAQDLTQDFFSRLLEKNCLAKADRDRGKFRTFLLGSLKNFLVNEWKRAGRLKRGGGVEFLSIDTNVAEECYAAEPARESNPDGAYEQSWAVTLIERVLAGLREEYTRADKARLFEELKGFIWGDKSAASYAEIAGPLNLTEGSVKVAVHRLRQRFRELLRALAAATNTTWSLEYRVRSYLAANCVQCHQPEGGTLAHWDARITTPTAAAGIINGRLSFPLPADPNGRVIVPGSLEHSMMFQRIANLGASHMPPLATTVVNAEAVNLLSEWITNGLANYQSFADWQLAFFGATNLPSAAPDADPDGDGASNQLEFLVGSNPLLPGDAWRISIQPRASSVHIVFPRLANRAFEVQWTTNLSDAKAWVPLDQPDNRPFFSSTNGQALIEDATTPSPARFYRVGIYEP